MAHQDAKLNIRNHLIYVGYFLLGYDMVEIGKAFRISKQMVSKIIGEISVRPSRLTSSSVTRRKIKKITKK